MAASTEMYLNALVVVSTAIVLFLVRDRMDTLLTPYTALEPEATVSVTELSQKCSQVWKDHRSNATEANGNKVDQWHTKPKYSSDGFCGRLPASLSAPHLWNEHLHWILEASSDVRDISSHLVTSKLLQFLTPSKYLELGHRARPSGKAWGRLLEKIEARLKSKEAPLVHVAAFGGGSVNCNVNEPGEKNPDQSSDSIDCLWPVRLEVFLNTILNHGQAKREKRAIINITPMNSPTGVTTEFNTAVVQNNLWIDYIKESGGPDVIISAFNAQDMFLPKRGYDAAEDIDYYHHHRQITQEFFRTCLELRECNEGGQQQEPPLLISVDDYVGNQQGPVMSENVQARVLQLLSDYYETAFVSYAEVIRKLVYASGNTHSPLVHTSLTDWTQDWQSLTGGGHHEMIEHGFLGPIAMTLTLAFSFLRYTVSYCEDKSNHNPDYTMVKEEVFQLVQDVPPPVLNTDLCLTNVTKLWQTERERQTNRTNDCQAHPEVGGPQTCSFAFWAGTHPSQERLDDYLQKYIAPNGMVGWQTNHGGRLVATQEGASLRLRLNAWPEKKGWAIKLFSVYKDSAAVPNTRLQWELSAGGRRRRLHSNYTEPRRHLQAATQTGTIEGTHDSPSTVVLPTTIPVDPTLMVSPLELKLNLIVGDSFEIVALMFCSESSYK